MARITDLGFSITDEMTNSDSNFQIACDETDMATIEAEVNDRNDDDKKRDDTHGTHSYANNALRNGSGYDYPLT